MRIISPLLEYLFASKKMKQVGSYEGAYTKSVYLPFTSNATLGQQYYLQPDDLQLKPRNFGCFATLYAYQKVKRWKA